MRRIESSAVVLGARDFGESDLLVDLLVRDAGRITGVAKSAKKSKRRFVNTFDIGHLIRVKFYRPRGRDLFLIEDAALIDPHMPIARDMRSMAYAALVLELTRELAPQEEGASDLFDTTATFLALLGERGAREDILWLFVLRILKIVGIAPHLSSCLRCRSSALDAEGSLFVPEAGGIVCAKCLVPRDRGVALSGSTSAALRAALDASIARLPRIALNAQSLLETRKILLSFVDHQLGKRMKSADFIERYLR